MTTVSDCRYQSVVMSTNKVQLVRVANFRDCLPFPPLRGTVIAKCIARKLATSHDEQKGCAAFEFQSQNEVKCNEYLASREHSPFIIRLVTSGTAIWFAELLAEVSSI